MGRSIKENDVQQTLETLSHINTDRKWEFTIVGDGPYRTELELFVQRLDLVDRFHFLGERKDIPRLLVKADIFVHIPV